MLFVFHYLHDKSAVDAKWNVSELLKEYNCNQTSLKVGRNIFKLATWSEQKKLNYLRHFLGDGFKKHIVDNNFLHNVFDCNVEEYRGPTLYVPEENEVMVKFAFQEIEISVTVRG